MAKFIKSKFRVLWGTVFSFFAGMFATNISAQDAASGDDPDTASEETVVEEETMAFVFSFVRNVKYIQMIRIFF